MTKSPILEPIEKKSLSQLLDEHTPYSTKIPMTKSNMKDKEKKVNKLYLFYLRKFCIISSKKAKELGLRWFTNVYGDEINELSSNKQICRSLWIDNKKNIYRVNSLKNNLWQMKIKNI